MCSLNANSVLLVVHKKQVSWDLAMIIIGANHVVQDDWMVSICTGLLSVSALTFCRVSLIFTLQTWLAESPGKRKSSSAGPGYLNVGLARKFHAQMISFWNQD